MKTLYVDSSSQLQKIMSARNGRWLGLVSVSSEEQARAEAAKHFEVKPEQILLVCKPNKTHKYTVWYATVE